MMRHFRCLQGKEARQTAQKAVQKGRRKTREKKRERREGAGRRIRQRLTRLARPRVGAHIGVRPSSRGIRLEEGTNQNNKPAKRWDRERGPCETDDVMRAEFRRLGGLTGQGEGQRAVTK
jgi:hypothetical protein